MLGGNRGRFPLDLPGIRCIVRIKRQRACAEQFSSGLVIQLRKGDRKRINAGDLTAVVQGTGPQREAFCNPLPAVCQRQCLERQFSIGGDFAARCPGKGAVDLRIQ